VSQTSFSPDFDVTVVRDGATGTVMQVRGELDSGTCDQLLEAFREASAEVGASELTLDLSGVSFIDSAGTRTMIMIEQSAREQGVSLRVVSPPGEVTELLRTAGVIDHLRLCSEPSRSEPSRSEPTSAELIELVELELPRDPHSPARARGEVRELLGDRDPTQVAGLVLMTSELVTNAVVHPRGVGQTPIGLRIICYQDHVRVEVDDAGEGFQRRAPERPEGERGRGLFLVDQFATRWDTERVSTEAGPRFRVWFELEWDEPGLAASAGG
jgi:anti-sigma B factor antagonist